MKLLQLLTPRTSRRNLLFIAAFIWTFAGGILLTRGIMMMGIQKDFLILRIAISLIGGAVFYALLFSKISKKHVARIIRLKIDRPCIFSFFNFRSYLMMTFMISFGVFLRKSGIFPPFYLSVLYVTMGIPLFASAFRFYYSGIYYHLVVGKMNQEEN
jgi:hypothetical protein